MAHSLSVNITLSEESFRFLQSKVASGEFASESDVLLESLEAFREEAEERTRFEQEEVIPAYDELMMNPSSAIPLEQVERHLEEARRLRLKAS